MATSHATSYEWLADFEREDLVETVTKTRRDDKHRITDHYRLMNHLSLRDGLATLILLAFLFHTVLEYIDKCYQILRAELPFRKTFFDDIRA